MERLHQQELPLVPQFDMATNICVPEENFFIKEEPDDAYPEDMLYDYPAQFLEAQMEVDLPDRMVYDEIDEAVMSRAVSPPCIPVYFLPFLETN